MHAQTHTPHARMHARMHARARMQVLVLGAGFDTSWFQLAAEGRAPHKYLELDFAEVSPLVL